MQTAHVALGRFFVYADLAGLKFKTKRTTDFGLMNTITNNQNQHQAIGGDKIWVSPSPLACQEIVVILTSLLWEILRMNWIPGWSIETTTDCIGIVSFTDSMSRFRILWRGSHVDQMSSFCIMSWSASGPIREDVESCRVYDLGCENQSGVHKGHQQPRFYQSIYVLPKIWIQRFLNNSLSHDIAWYTVETCSN